MGTTEEPASATPADEEAAESNDTVVGLELTTTASTGSVSVRCRDSLCTESQKLQAAPQTFVLRIVGAQASLRSFWHHHHHLHHHGHGWHHHGGHHHGWHHHHHHHHGWGHRHGW